MSAHGHSDTRGGPVSTRSSRTMVPTATPRGGSTRSTGPARPTGALNKQGGRRNRRGRISRRSLRGPAGLSQHAHGGIRRALGAISVESRLKLGRRPRVLEPMDSPLPEIAPTARCDGAIGPRAGPELGKGEVSLARHLSGPNLGQPGPMPTIEVHGKGAGVIQIDPELCDIVDGSFKNLRANARSREAEGPQVAVPADPPSPGLRVSLARREGAHHVGLLRGAGSPSPRPRHPGRTNPHPQGPWRRNALPGKSVAKRRFPTRPRCPPQEQPQPQHQRW